ncbi:MAG: cupin domain-containing protein [Actinobacteria bacterium]|nr:cupin domain-containing protein [Actinomycetota bacterium]
MNSEAVTGPATRKEPSGTERQVRILRRDQGDTVRVLGDHYTTKGRAADTEGRYSFFEASNNPGGGVPLHYHTHDEESFYVVEGTYEFRAGDATVVARPGDYLFVPRPTPHAFFNIGATVGRVIIILSPGGIHERFFGEIGEPVEDLRDLPPPTPPDLEKFATALERAGIVMLEEPASPGP